MLAFQSFVLVLYTSTEVRIQSAILSVCGFIVHGSDMEQDSVYPPYLPRGYIGGWPVIRSRKEISKQVHIPSTSYY